jgi:hypothetical protein
MKDQSMSNETSVAAAAETQVDATVGGYSAEFTWPVAPFGAMPVRIDEDFDGSILASDLITDSYGVGASVPQALAALELAIREHYRFLRSETPQLSSRLAAQLEILERRRATAAPRRGGHHWTQLYAA